VTLRLKLAPGSAYCDQASSCGQPRHIGIRTPAGQLLGTGVDFFACETPCSTCQRPPCPGAACFPRGWAVADEELRWDGQSVTRERSCGLDMCYRTAFVPPGSYVAVMCATPGKLTTPDGGDQPTCTNTGPMECVEIPFQFPSATPVDGMLGR
jgi:hypothetical protein